MEYADILEFSGVFCMKFSKDFMTKVIVKDCNFGKVDSTKDDISLFYQ